MKHPFYNKFLKTKKQDLNSRMRYILTVLLLATFLSANVLELFVCGYDGHDGTYKIFDIDIQDGNYDYNFKWNEGEILTLPD